jgi:uncharacterized protein (DUF2062 family)
MSVPKIRAFFLRHYHKLMQIRDTPHAVAGGLAIGLFIGFTPLLFLKTALGLLVAWLTRCSKLAAVIGVTTHDLLWPVWWIILRWQYLIGYWVLNHRLPPKLKDVAKHINLHNVFDWKTLKILWPTFIGSVVMALPLSLLCYFIALKIVARYQAKMGETVTYS